MPKIINVPIESLEERYSAQWNRWFPETYKVLGVKFINCYGTPLSDKIRQGRFLDVIGTNYFKASQLKTLLKLIDKGKIGHNDIIFFHDLWFPGLEMLAYVRDALQINFKIAGILHAGTYDPEDFLTQMGMEDWGEHVENAWFKIADIIFTNSHFHKKMLHHSRGVRWDKMFAVGYPFYPKSYNLKPNVKKENIVVFPHRLDPEKQPQKFDMANYYLEPLFPDWQFIRTKDVWTNKQAYYDLLNRAKIAVSFATQETFGIAMVESVLCGCIPIVPERLSYKELYGINFRCEDDNGVIDGLRTAMKNADELLNSTALRKQREYFLENGSKSIERMVRIMMNNYHNMESCEWPVFKG